ncbi:MAG: hydroxymethylbilane synthase [Pirellulaceae bacterium]|nr:hydroxymethylbilane synthase [Pirellulaceae bacterium]
MKTTDCSLQSTQATVTTIKIGTRRSELAMWQTRYVARLISESRPELSVVEVPVTTQGDLELEKPLPVIGGKGLFTAELDKMLLTGEIDCAVHSLKDLPVAMPPGIAVGAVLARDDVRDVWVCPNGHKLDEIEPGSVVGTSSVRRSAQLLARRPDLQIRSIRGNVPTRIEKADRGEFDAVVLAAAGLNRLGLSHLITEHLPVEAMLPAPGQGALAVTCRENDSSIRDVLAVLNQGRVALCTTAERQFLKALGGGCSAPIAAFATIIEGSETIIELRGTVISPDGQESFSASLQGSNAEQLGHDLAAKLLQAGAGKVIKSWRAQSNSMYMQTVSAKHICDNTLPLSGRRIVVTRATQDVDELCDLLETQGATSIAMPVLQFTRLPVENLPEKLNRLSADDWVLFTSRHAIEFLAELDASWIASSQCKFGCVGPATASALALLGRQADFVPTKFVGQTLADQLPIGSGCRVLWVRPKVADERLTEILQDRGAIVEEQILYETKPLAITNESFEILQNGVDAVTFASSSAAEHFLGQLIQRGSNDIPKFTIACIGPVTADTVRLMGWTVDLVASEHTLGDLVASLGDYFSSDTGESNRD